MAISSHSAPILVVNVDSTPPAQIMRYRLFTNTAQSEAAFFQDGACFDVIRGARAGTTRFLKLFPT